MPSIKLIEPAALKDMLDQGEEVQILDVRNDEEVEVCQIPGATHIPMNDIPDRISELDPKLPTVVYCHHGMRSQMVAGYLLENGFTDVANLQGGIDSYAEAVDPEMSRY